MTKEEAERERAQVSTSSLPPRPAHTVAPSIPPQTDDIDTDWGVESEAAPPVAKTAAPPIASAPVSPGLAPPDGASPLAASVPSRVPSVVPSARNSAPPPAPVAEERAVRHVPIRSRTLIGIAAPPTPPTPAVDCTPLPLASVRSAEKLEVDAEASRSVAPAAPGAIAPPPNVQVAPLPPSAPPRAPVEPAVTRTTAPHELEASHARPLQASPAANNVEPAHSMRVYALLAAAAVVVAALAYVRLHRSSSAPSAEAVTPTPAQTSASAAASAIAEPAALAAAPSATADVPMPSSGAASSEPSSADSDAPAASANTPAASSDAPADTAGTITVTVDSQPPHAQFFHFGKQVGIAPFVVQLKPGEHHAYEVGLPGHITRKLVLDGSKTELTVGLREEPR